MALSLAFIQPPYYGGGIPNAQPCSGRHLMTGQWVRARHRVEESGGFWAYANPDYDGHPVIRYSQAYFRLPRTVQLFVAHHECGHHERSTSNEFTASCYALDMMRPNEWQLREIAYAFAQIPSVGLQYGGGSGSDFWRAVRYRCGY